MKNTMKCLLVIALNTNLNIYSQVADLVYSSNNIDTGANVIFEEVDPWITIDEENNQFGLVFTTIGYNGYFIPTPRYWNESDIYWGHENISPSGEEIVETRLFHITNNNQIISFRVNNDFSNLQGETNYYLSSGSWRVYKRENNEEWNLDKQEGSFSIVAKGDNNSDEIHFGKVWNVNNQNELSYYKRLDNGNYNPDGIEITTHSNLHIGSLDDLAIGPDGIPYFCFYKNLTLYCSSTEGDDIEISGIENGYIDPWSHKLNKNSAPSIAFNQVSNKLMVVFPNFDTETNLWSLYYSKYGENTSQWTTPVKVFNNLEHLAYPSLAADPNSGNFYLSFYTIKEDDGNSVTLNTIGFSGDTNLFGTVPFEVSTMGYLLDDGYTTYWGRPIHSKMVPYGNTTKLLITGVSFEDGNDTDVELYSVEFPNQVQYTFRNMIEEEDAGENLKLTNNNTGVVEEFLSGSSRSLNIDDFYTIETLPRVFTNFDYLGEIGDYKHHNWNGVPLSFRYSMDIFPTHFDGTIEANYHKISNITFSSDYESLNSFFRDPWYFNPETQTQPNEFHPLSEQVDESGNLQVFLSQNPDFETGIPTYSVKTPQYIGKQDGIYEFSGWSATPEGDAEFENPNNRTSRVVFLQSGVTIEPEYDNLISDGLGVIFIEDKLIIPPGADINFGTGFSIIVSYDGEIIANGTEANPIQLRSDGASWGGISVWDRGKLTLSNTAIENTNTGILAQSLFAYGDEPNQFELNNVHFINNITGLKIEGGFYDDGDGSYNINVSGCDFDSNEIGIEIINLGYSESQISSISISNTNFLSNGKGIYSEYTVENLSINNCNFDGSDVGIEITDHNNDTQIIELSVSNSTFSANERGILAGKNVRLLDIGNNTFSENDSTIVISQVWTNEEIDYTNTKIHHNNFTNSDNPIRIKQFWPNEYDGIGAESNIHHNTFYNSKDAIHYVKMDGISEVWNNSFLQGSQWAIYARVQCTGMFEAINNIVISFHNGLTITGNEFVYNYFSDMTADNWSSGIDPSNIIGNDGDPIFIDPPYNFHLLPASVCIDTGKPDVDGDGIDFDGLDNILGNADDDLDDQDPDGTRMDLGAFYFIAIPTLEIIGDVGQHPTISWNEISFANGSIPTYEIYSYNEFDQTPVYFNETVIDTIVDNRFIIAYIEEDETGRNVGLKKIDKEPEQTSRIKQYWKLKVRDPEGNQSVYSDAEYAWVEIESSAEKLATTIIPKDYVLNAAFPNPFNPTINIPFGLPFETDVSIDIYNIMGQRVRRLQSENIRAGFHTVHWNSTNNSGQRVPSGLYIVQMKANSTDGMKSFSKSQKIILLK